MHCRKSSYRFLDTTIADLGWSAIDGLFLDLGVNSLQLDEPSKGFSYRADGPLDLRFDQTSGQPASQLLADLDEVELARLLHEYGEVRGSRRLARAILEARIQSPISTTGRLSVVVAAALPRGARPEPDPGWTRKSESVGTRERWGGWASLLGLRWLHRESPPGWPRWR